MRGIACNKGFTLIELLLAMAISAFVALVGYQGLRVAIDASGRVEQESRQLADIELALGILEKDISHIIARPVRNELGTLEPILSGGLSNDALLMFTRTGWSNPRGLRRSELARINYQWIDGVLKRQRWRILDRVNFEDSLEEVSLLENVEEVRIEFFTPRASSDPVLQSIEPGLPGQWQKWWSSERLGLDFVEPLPSLIRITLFVEGFGELTRVINIASE